MIDKNSIGKIIQKRRKDKNFTQDELAEKIDISTNYLSKVERGLSKLNIETFFKIAEILELSLDDFGIKHINKIDTTIDEILQVILSSSSYENEKYLKILKILKET